MAKGIRFTRHSIINIAERSIDKGTVELTINVPDVVSEGYDKRKVFTKKFYDKDLSQEILLRAPLKTSFKSILTQRTQRSRRDRTRGVPLAQSIF